MKGSLADNDKKKYNKELVKGAERKSVKTTIRNKTKGSNFNAKCKLQ